MNNQYMLDNLARRKEQIEDMIRNYQQPISQQTVKDYLELRILNENEEVDNLFVPNKTLFLGDKNMVLKGVDGSLQKWDIVKTYPIDKKDERINELEQEIIKLKEVVNEYTKSTSTVGQFNKPDGTTNVNAKPEPKTSGKSIPSKE